MEIKIVHQAGELFTRDCYPARCVSEEEVFRGSL
jgi:hypothetical protein